MKIKSMILYNRHKMQADDPTWVRLPFTLKLFKLLTFIFCISSLNAQPPEKISYQAVVRDANNSLVTNSMVGMQVSILQGSETGIAVYVEKQTPASNTNGLVTIEIGAGSVVSGDFAAIDWTNGPYFLKTETDPEGGTNYLTSIITQFLSAPYALHAKSAGSITGTYDESDPEFTDWDKSTGISITESQISDFGSYEPAFIKNTAFNKNFGTTSGTVTEGDDARLSDARTPTSHAAGHTDGTDDIQDATSIQKGLMTTTYVTKLDGIEAGAEANVNADWDASSGDAQILNKPSDVTDLSGHNATELSDITSQDITDLGNLSGVNTGDQDLSALALKSNVLELDNTTAFTPDADYEPATKKYMDDNEPITYSVGDWAHGGIVFWVDETGKHGLVCAKEDQNGGSIIRWYANYYGSTQAKGDGPFSGKANTVIIIAAHTAIGDDGSSYAARICNELTVTEDEKTYGDWYLPSQQELNLMYQNKATIDATATANGGSAFTSDNYWSSTECDSYGAWGQSFSGGGQVNFPKVNALMVRAIRAF
jgi:hypothetical protein